jgi:hypothetical protein
MRISIFAVMVVSRESIFVAAEQLKISLNDTRPIYKLSPNAEASVTDGQTPSGPVSTVRTSHSLTR